MQMSAIILQKDEELSQKDEIIKKERDEKIKFKAFAQKMEKEKLQMEKEKLLLQIKYGSNDKIAEDAFLTRIDEISEKLQSFE